MNLHENIQRIKEVMGINESALSSIKRRLGELPRHVRSTYNWLNPKAFYDFDEFIDRVIFSTTRDFVSELGIDDYEEQTNTRDEVTPFIRQYIMDNHLDEIRDEYDKIIGSINEGASESKINKMIDELGLYNTIKMVGNYKDLSNHINPEDISNIDKIKFIEEFVDTKGFKLTGRGSISIFDLGIPPIPYDSYGNTERVITTFYSVAVKIVIYKSGVYSTSQFVSYDRISEDTLDKIFNIMIDLLDDKKEEMIEGLHDTSWENDEGDKITLVDLLDATEDIPVKNIPVKKIKSKLLTWDDDDKEVAKIEKANLKYPILIFVDDNNKFISIIDGHHRAQKAVRHKLKKIKAKIIPINSLPKDVRKVFSHLGKQEQNESELTERCWKGYTQKGMKTMFGKRYPNCVKIKK